MMKKLKKYSKIVSLSTILLSTGCTPLAHANNQSKVTFHLGAQSRALKSLQATKYSNELSYNSEYDPQNVTETRFNDYFNAVSDKLQYELWAANCSDEEVYSTVGTFKANVLNCELSDAKDEQEKINIKYAKLKAEAKKLGIDVIDFDLYRNFAIPKLVTDFKQTLSNIGISEQQIEVKQDIYEQYLISVFEQANVNLWGDEEFNLAMPSLYDLIYNYTSPQSTNDIQEISLFNSLNNIDFYNQSEQEYKSKLSIVLNWVFEHFSNSSSQNEGTENANNFCPGIVFKKDVDLSMFWDYSSNEEGYKVGDTIKSEDMSELFDFSYSKVQGCDYASEFFLDDIEPTESGEYNKDTISNIYEVKSLDTYDSAYATYGLAEILPGFTLNAKIKSLDSITDSHKCSLEIELGVSHSSNPDYVLWSDFNTNSSDSTNDKEEPITMKGEFPCLKDQDIINVSNKVYSSEYDKNLNDYKINLGQQKTEKYLVIKPGQEFDPEKDPETEYVDVYFCDSKDQRTNLDDIMETYDSLDDSDTYDLENNPVLLDENATKGILNEEQWKKINELNSEESKEKNFHTNQFIAPIGTRIDTNENILWIKLSIVDQFNGKVLPIKDIDWEIEKDGETFNIDTIPVLFNVNQNNQNYIEAQIEYLSWLSTTFFASGNAATNCSDDVISEFNETRKTLRKYYDAKIGIDSSILVVVIAEEAIDVIATGPVGALTLFLAAAFIAATSFSLAITVKEFDSFKGLANNAQTFTQLHKKILPYKEKLSEYNEVLSLKQVKQYIFTLTDPIVKYSKKLSVAKEAASKIDEYENWLGKEFLTSIKGVFDMDEQTEKELDIWKLLEIWGNDPITVVKKDDPVKTVYLPMLSSLKKFFDACVSSVVITFAGNIINHIVYFMKMRSQQTAGNTTPEEALGVRADTFEENVMRDVGMADNQYEDLRTRKAVYQRILKNDRIKYDNLLRHISNQQLFADEVLPNKVWTLFVQSEDEAAGVRYTCYFSDSYNSDNFFSKAFSLGNFDEELVHPRMPLSNEFIDERDIYGECVKFERDAEGRWVPVIPEENQRLKAKLHINFKYGEQRTTLSYITEAKEDAEGGAERWNQVREEAIKGQNPSYIVDDTEVTDLMKEEHRRQIRPERVAQPEALPAAEPEIERAADLESKLSKIRKSVATISTSPIKLAVFLVLNTTLSIAEAVMTDLIAKIYV